MKKYKVPNTHSWKKIVDKMVDLLFVKKEFDNKLVLEFIKKTREYFYILFITNIYSTCDATTSTFILLHSTSSYFSNVLAA